MRIIDCRGRDYRCDLPRGSFNIDDAIPAVAQVCEAVRSTGRDALAQYSSRFDHVVPPTFLVPPEVAQQCFYDLDSDLANALRLSIERRRIVCEAEADLADRIVRLDDGASVTIRTVPVERVGLYIPGGLAPLASSVIMNQVPARVAGVRSIALASPPQAEHGGYPHPTILAVAHMLGIQEIYAVGGAQAIAMFAYGVADLCAPVDMITGPGNMYVAAAKRYVSGEVAIDSEAGPTEIVVLADDSADPKFVAADLLSQAEHDPNAASVLVTDSPRLADDVQAALGPMLEATKHRDRAQIALDGTQSAIMIVDSIDVGIDVVNTYAAEHLEIQTRDPSAVAKRITNAGAIFVGPYSPVSLGDYCAGSTHVLPTGGSSTHSSGLTVRSFLKTVHVINYGADALASIADEIVMFANAENLPAHANAILARRQS